MDEWRIRVESKIDVQNALLSRFVEEQDRHNKEFYTVRDKVNAAEARNGVIAAIGVCVSGLIAAIVSGIFSK